MKKITKIKRKFRKIKSFFEQIKFINSIVICLVIIILFVIFTDTSNIDEAIKCNKIKGDFCTQYDIEKMKMR